MKTLHRAAALAGLLAAGAAVAAEPTIISNSMLQFEADEFEGAQLRETVSNAFTSKVGSVQKWALLQPALAFCDTRQDSATQVVASVSTHAERKELLATRTDSRPVVFVDIACPRAYQQAAYFAADDGDAAKAMRYLDRAEQLAPYLASARTERGYLLNAAGQREPALAAYRRALELAERYPASANVKALALRGIGWTLIELGRLDEARDAFERSLVEEPGNRTAFAELEVIADLQKKGAKADSPAISTKVAADDSGQPLSGDPARVVAYTRYLEEKPFDPQAPALRKWLIAWVEDAPDVSVTICNTLGVIGEPRSKFASELLVQGMFGMAAFLIEHPEAKDDRLAQQRAGALSALRAYATMLRAHPDARVPTLDAYLAHQAAGDFDAHFAPVVAKECSGS